MSGRFLGRKDKEYCTTAVVAAYKHAMFPDEFDGSVYPKHTCPWAYITLVFIAYSLLKAGDA